MKKRRILYLNQQNREVADSLEGKISEEILREENGLNEGFIALPITDLEAAVLLDAIAV